MGVSPMPLNSGWGLGDLPALLCSGKFSARCVLLRGRAFGRRLLRRDYTCSLGAGIARRPRPARHALRCRQDGRAALGMNLPILIHGLGGNARRLPVWQGAAIFICTDPAPAVHSPLPPDGGAPGSSDFRATLGRNNADFPTTESCAAPFAVGLTQKLPRRRHPRLMAGAPIHQVGSRSRAQSQPPRESSNPSRGPARLSSAPPPSSCARELAGPTPGRRTRDLPRPNGALPRCARN